MCQVEFVTVNTSMPVDSPVKRIAVDRPVKDKTHAKSNLCPPMPGAPTKRNRSKSIDQ